MELLWWRLLTSSLFIFWSASLTLALQPHPHHPQLAYKVVDYYAKPQYAFGYEVEDYLNLLSHGRWETRDGDVVRGQYRQLLPDGRIQIVSYVADKFGYRPTIQYINTGVHPPPPPKYSKVAIPKLIAGPIAPAPPPPPKPIIISRPQPITPIYSPTYPHPHSYPQHGLGHGGPLNYGGAGLSYGGHGGFIDPYYAAGSMTDEQKAAVLYGKTLYRRDVPKGKGRKRIVVKRKRKVSLASHSSPIPPPSSFKVELDGDN